MVGTFLNFFLSETPIDKKDMFMDIDTEKNVVQKVIEEEEGEQKEENLEDE